KAEFGIKLKKTDTDEKKDEKKEKVSYDVLRKFEDREKRWYSKHDSRLYL
ncbi:MAG: hypothetical protein IPH34_16280, partial [Chitinophagaceae bacterium]|nr:hypothetical protein [Chitinophagaceae bacterium]